MSIDKNEIPNIINSWIAGTDQTTIALKYHVSKQAISQLILYNVPIEIRREVQERKRKTQEKIIIKKTLEERFWEKVDKKNSDVCWNWLAAIDHLGYGKFNYPEANNYAHRTSWILTYGPIPKGLWILHKCDNPRCVNPNIGHLYLGTPTDNERDARENNITFDYKKCNNEEIKRIRELRKSFTLSKIAEEYGVSTTTIWKYCR